MVREKTWPTLPTPSDDQFVASNDAVKVPPVLEYASNRDGPLLLLATLKTICLCELIPNTKPVSLVESATTFDCQIPPLLVNSRMRPLLFVVPRNPT